MTVSTVRAATYARQSKQREDESAGSPQAQQEQTAAFVAAKGWRFVEHFKDLGASGYDPKAERPGLAALLAAVRRGEVDRVVVYRLDRLTRRGVVEAVRLVGELDKAGASIASVNESFLDTSTAMGRGIFALFAAMAEQESENISNRTCSTKAVLRAAGSFAGGQRPYGYTFAKTEQGGLTLTTLTPEKTEAAVVQQVVSSVLAGASIASEARRLNAEGVRTATGSEWATSTLSRLLKTPVIAGYLVERRYVTLAAPGEKATGPYDQVIVRDDSARPVSAWEPIVDPDLWHNLQAVLADGRGQGRRTDARPSLLGGSDLLHCAACGGRMGADRRLDRRGIERGSYRCMRHRRGSATCAGAAISMPHLDEYLTRIVWERAGDLDPKDSDDLGLLRAIADRYAERRVDPVTEGDRRAAAALLADAETALSRLDDDRAAGAFPGGSGQARYLRQVAALGERADSARAALAALSKAAPQDDLFAVLDMLSELRTESGRVDVFGTESPWASWTLQERRDFLTLFLNDVRVSKATGRGGGDKVEWQGHERLTIEWAGDVPVWLSGAATHLVTPS